MKINHLIKHIRWKDKYGKEKNSNGTKELFTGMGFNQYVDRYRL